MAVIEPGLYLFIKGAVAKCSFKDRRKAEQINPKGMKKLCFFGIIELMKNKYNRDNYNTNGRVFQVKIDIFNDKNIIPENDSVRLLNSILEGMDYTSLWRAYKRTGRKPAANPVTMFKVLVYGSMEGIYSSRALETACRRDINFKWLLWEEDAPNHSEIARFRSKRLPYAAEDLFCQLVMKLAELDEISFGHLFVDGTKLYANANPYSFVWKKATDKYAERLVKKLVAFRDEIGSKYGFMLNDEITNEDMLELLSEQAKIEGIEFVFGRGKRKSELQRDAEKLTEYIRKGEKYSKYNELFDGRNSFSKTDTDATFMHMKDDRMQNAQLKPGYNIQLAVEGEYITGLDVSSERSDQLTLIPLIERMEKNTGRVYSGITADAELRAQ